MPKGTTGSTGAPSARQSGAQFTTKKSRRKLAQVTTYLQAHPKARIKRIAAEFSMSTQNAQRYRAEAIRRGMLVIPCFLDL